jgi:myosin heavy subunit
MVMHSYHQKATTASHLYQIADQAYNALRQSMCNQSILVTGQSGAGKTEATKYTMKYLTENLGATDHGVKPTLQDQIISTSAILEAFGTAQTTRNHNSSRYGKVVKISFNHDWTLQKASFGQ